MRSVPEPAIHRGGPLRGCIAPSIFRTDRVAPTPPSHRRRRSNP